MIEQPCQTCGGKRLKAESLAVLVNGRGIGDVVDLPVERAIEFFESIPQRGRSGASSAAAGNGGAPPVDAEIAGPILKEVIDRLRFLRDVGLEYPPSAEAPPRSRAERPSGSASPPRSGHASSVLYILDEPSIGLTSATTSACSRPCGTQGPGQHGHRGGADADTIEAADHVIDLGSEGGPVEGGSSPRLVGEESEHPSSLTGQLFALHGGDGARR